MLKKLLILIVITNLSSCGLLVEKMPNSWQWGFKPRPLSGVRNFPSADTEYGKGFKDGCLASLDGVSKGLTSDLEGQYDFKRMTKSPDYNTGWWDGYEQCTYIMDWDVS